MSEADQVKLYAVSSFGRFVFRPAPVTGYLDIAFGGELLQYRCHLGLAEPGVLGCRAAADLPACFHQTVNSFLILCEVGSARHRQYCLNCILTDIKDRLPSVILIRFLNSSDACPGLLKVMHPVKNTAENRISQQRDHAVHVVITVNALREAARE